MKISRRNKNARLSFIKKRGSKSRIKRTNKRNHKQNGGNALWSFNKNPKLKFISNTFRLKMY